MQIIPDPLVVALQLVPFLLTLAALHFIIFKPMIEFLDEREHARTGGRQEAEGLSSRIAEKMAEVEARMAQAHSEVVDLRAERRAAALAQAAARIEQAKAQAEAQVQASVADIELERQAAAAGLRASADELALDITGRVLGRGLQAG
jgi:F-type H+-transporting ATPase subunit b